MLGLRPISKIDSALAARAHFPTALYPQSLRWNTLFNMYNSTDVKISYHILITLSIGFEYWNIPAFGKSYRALREPRALNILRETFATCLASESTAMRASS